MSEFTKTLIVDANGSGYTTIKAAADALITAGRGGTILVERGMYTIGADSIPVGAWSVEDGGWTITGDTAVNTIPAKNLYQTLNGLTSGNIYALIYEVTVNPPPGAQLFLKGTDKIPFGEKTLNSEVGVHVCYLRCLNPAQPISFQSDGPITMRTTVSIWEFTDTVLIPSNVTIKGQGDVQIVVTGSAPAFMNEGCVRGVANSGVHLDSLSITVRFDGTSFTGQNKLYQGNVIHLEYVSDSSVENVHVTCDQSVNQPYYGISPFVGAIAINNTGLLYPGYSFNNIVQNCIVENFGRTSTILPVGVPVKANFYGFGIVLLHRCYHTIVRNNFTSHSGGNKIGHAETLYSIVSNNVCIDSVSTDPPVLDPVNFLYGVGILITSPYSTVCGNILNGLYDPDPQDEEVLVPRGGHGMYPSSNAWGAINANICCDNRHSGIKPAWSVAKLLTICGNVCYHNGFPATEANPIRGNGIQLNGYVEPGNPGYPTLINVSANICAENNSAGIRTDWPVTGIGSKNNIVANNICSGNDGIDLDIMRQGPETTINADNLLG